MRRRKDRLPPNKSSAFLIFFFFFLMFNGGWHPECAFWLEHLSDFDRRCCRLTITCAIKVQREQNETSRRGQVLQLLKIGCESLDDDTLYSHWSESVMTGTTCVVCVYSNNSFPIMLTNRVFITVKLFSVVTLLY